jgi:TIR domain
MYDVFLSYSRSNSDEVSALAAQLRARGIRVWREIDTLPAGRLCENESRQAISSECWGLAAYLTPESMTSDFVMSVELPAAIIRKQSNPGFPIIPLFRSITLDETRKASLAKLGVDLTAYNGHIIGSDVADAADLQNHFRISANKALRAYLSQAFNPAQPGHDHKPRLDLHTWPSRRNDPPPDLDLDWSRFFSNESLPSYDVWQSLLLFALNDVKDALAEITGPRTLCARAMARLSAGLALGFIFRQPSRFNIEIEQDGEIWSKGASRSQATPL